MNTLTKKTTQNDTITIDAIIDFALKNGKSFDAYSEFTDRWGDRANDISYIGIELKSNIWFWWKSFNIDGEGSIMFDHRYNCGNGAIMKSYRQATKAENIILNRKF